jgi:cell division protein FtsW
MLSWLYRPQNSLSRLDKSILGQWWWTVDRGMLTVFLLMAVLGVVMVASASPPVAAHLKLPHFHFLVRHVIILIPALIMMIGVSLLDQRQIWRLATLLLLGCFAAMIMVLVAGAEIKGAQRWIRILGFSLQPSEFAKPAFIIVGAWMMAFQKQKNADEISTEKQGRFKVIDALNANWSVACVYGILITLLLLQPDLGMTIVVTVVFATQIFLAGLPFRYLIGFVLVGVGALVIAYFSFHHVQSRIDRFLYPESGDNYQVERSLEAFENGGIMGVGPGQGVVKLQLPDGHADFIYAVAAEEMGVIFVLILAGLIYGIVLRGIRLLSGFENVFCILAAGGLITMFGLQSFIHIASSLNLIPTKGMTLPFISYGGSSLLAISFSAGAILSLTRRQKKSGISGSSISAKR